MLPTQRGAWRPASLSPPFPSWGPPHAHTTPPHPTTDAHPFSGASPSATANPKSQARSTVLAPPASCLAWLWPALPFLWGQPQHQTRSGGGLSRAADQVRRRRGPGDCTRRALRGGRHLAHGSGARGQAPAAGTPGALTQARVGPPLAQAGGFHQEHAGLVRHPRAERQQQDPQEDAALAGREEGGRWQREAALRSALRSAPHTRTTASSAACGSPSAARLSLETPGPDSVPLPSLVGKGPVPGRGGHRLCPGTSDPWVSGRSTRDGAFPPLPPPPRPSARSAASPSSPHTRPCAAPPTPPPPAATWVGRWE